MHDVPYEIGILILDEVCRVLRETGLVYIVDHGGPKDSPAARILYWILLTYGTPNHKLFFNYSLRDYFAQTGPRNKCANSLLFGAVQSVTTEKTVSQFTTKHRR